MTTPPAQGKAWERNLPSCELSGQVNHMADTSPVRRRKHLRTTWRIRIGCTPKDASATSGQVHCSMPPQHRTRSHEHHLHRSARRVIDGTATHADEAGDRSKTYDFVIPWQSILYIEMEQGS